MSSSTATSTNPLTGRPFSANYHTVLRMSRELPVSQNMPEILEAIKSHNVVILSGETGSGKTTQVPKAILLLAEIMEQVSGGKVSVTQNRRLAAQLVGERIAEELDVKLDGTVIGVRYKGRNSTNPDTRLEIVTDGSLLSTAKGDQHLSQYGVIIIDEAHQHTLSTDLLLGLLKELASSRKNDLKVIIMSATIDAKLFLDFFPGSVHVEVKGRGYPVQVNYLAPGERADDAIDWAIETVILVHVTKMSGSILVFAPGVLEITQIIGGVRRALAQLDNAAPMTCYPLYATQTPEAQSEAIESVAPTEMGRNGRKLIVATNIAETSVTLTGITHVIDTLRYKANLWNPRNESFNLEGMWVSKATAKQRSGRAGRTKPGQTWRASTQADYDGLLEAHSSPAILESDLVDECLSILKMGRNPIDFPYIVPPAPETIVRALGILRDLGLVSKKDTLTNRGLVVTSLPVTVFSALMLLESVEEECSDDMLSLVSILEASEGGNSLWKKPDEDGPDNKAKLRKSKEKFRHPTGDHLRLYNVYRAWRYARLNNEEEEFLDLNMLHGTVLRAADELRLQMLPVLLKVKDYACYGLQLDQPDFYVPMLKVLASCSFLRVAKLDPSNEKVYTIVRSGDLAVLPKNAALKFEKGPQEWVVYNDYQNDNFGTREIRVVTTIPPEFLFAGAPIYWSKAVEFLPDNHVKDGVVKIMAEMTDMDPDVIRRGMPSYTTA